MHQTSVEMAKYAKSSAERVILLCLAVACNNREAGVVSLLSVVGAVGWWWLGSCCCCFEMEKSMNECKLSVFNLVGCWGRGESGRLERLGGASEEQQCRRRGKLLSSFVFVVLCWAMPECVQGSHLKNAHKLISILGHGKSCCFPSFPNTLPERGLWNW